MLESVYEEWLACRLTKKGFTIKRQVPIPVVYETIKMELGFRAGLIVENCVVVEINSVEALAPVHHKQWLTYLKLTEITVGLLINFNEALLKNGLKRVVNNYLPASSAPPREIKT